MPHPLPEGIEGVKLMCQSTNDPSKRALFALQGMAGLRVSEARSLHSDNIDIQDMMLTVRGKGDKTRAVPISNSAWPFVLDAYKASLESGMPLVNLSDRGARKAVTAAGHALGFKRDISSHDLRATGATHLYNQTKDIRVVQEFLGHASSVTTQVYTGISIDAMRKGLEF